MLLHDSWVFLVVRILLVAMFPFSAIDKAIHWNAAMVQCRSSFIPGAPWMLVVARVVEVVSPVCNRRRLAGARRRCGAGRLLRGHGGALPPVLAGRRLLGSRRQRRSRPFLGFHQELRSRRLTLASPSATASAPRPDRQATRTRRSSMSDTERSPPTAAYWHLWTDAQGVSHQSLCAPSAFELAQVGQAAAQWNDVQARGEATIVFTVQPVGWVGKWHENPAPQWIVPLSGRWWVEAMDGQRVEMANSRSAKTSVAWPMHRGARDIDVQPHRHQMRGLNANVPERDLRAPMRCPTSPSAAGCAVGCFYAPARRSTPSR